MDIVRFKGGLGNQMFQYALVESLRSQGRDVYCSLGFYGNHPDLRPFILNDVFQKVNIKEIDDELFEKINKKWQDIKNNEEQLKRFLLDRENRFFYVENEDGKYDQNIFATKNCTFVGYWQSEKYFKNIQDNIKNVFSFTNLESALEKLGKQLRNNYISVHVRRGDYLDIDIFYSIQIDYYYNAMNYMKKIFPDVHFVFFSDDIEWVKYNFDFENMIICVPELFMEYKDWYDMYLMTLCKGNIIANSSFSWWGAWLNKNENPVVVAPNKWFNGLDATDIWCEEWIKI